MDSVGSFEAKTHLPELLKRVAKGEVIQITRRGVPVARLIPADESDARDYMKLAREIREQRKGIRLGGIPIRELIDHGRRH